VPTAVALVLLVGGAYLLGSIPTALLIARHFGIDIRQHGSGNVGSTNAARVLGWRWGLLVQAVDIAKGALAAELLPKLLPSAPALGVGFLAGIAATAGHCWSPWANFQGGKGVNTAAGALLVLAPTELLFGIGAFALALLVSGYVSLGSLAAAMVVPLSIGLRYVAGALPSSEFPWMLAGSLVLSGIVVLRHRSNIERLWRGTEYRFERLWLPGWIHRLTQRPHR
jgi:glycerol-3-phosphate acyltransferase PlsY